MGTRKFSKIAVQGFAGPHINAANASRCGSNLLLPRLALLGEQPPGSLRFREVVWRVLFCSNSSRVSLQRIQYKSENRNLATMKRDNRRRLVLLQTLRTRDFDQLAQAFPQWDLRFRQLGRGPFRGQLQFLQQGAIQRPTFEQITFLPAPSGVLEATSASGQQPGCISLICTFWEILTVRRPKRAGG